ncbi:MAG TPA: MMPL family transporter [Acidimicrobiales bacterium]|nr:MMPL family transporter [Acidimicrobiales bacterium]
MLTRLARGCYRRRWFVLAGWALVLVGLMELGSAHGGRFVNDFRLPGSESQRAIDLLDAHDFPTRSGHAGQVVFAAPDIDDPAVTAGMQDLFADLDRIVAPGEVVSPYEPEGEHFVNPERTIAFAQVNMAERDEDRYDAAAARARALVAAADVPGTTVELGGNVFAESPEFSSELVGFGAAMVVLLLAFGSVLAMGLPLVTAATGIVAGISIVTLVVRVVGMPSYAIEAVAMIGIGVGIDYALFVVTRYREGLRGGLDPEAATVRSLETAGRAVLLAGTVVVIGVMGMLTAGLAMIRGLAIGISLGVLATMLASVTLLPALLGFAGTAVDRLALPGRRGRDERRSAAWGRWSRTVQARPWPALALGVGLLAVLAVPALGLRHGFGDAGNRPRGDTTRRAYDLVADGFGPGANGPLVIAADLPGGPPDVFVLMELWHRLSATPGVAMALPPLLNDVGDAAVLQVFPASSPQAAGTQELVHRLRDDVLPPALAGTTITAEVGGATAASVDFGEFTADHLPWFTGSVLVVSFALLTIVFRSLLVPVKAVAVNLLALGASYGLLVVVFQWGWGLGLLGVGRPGPIDAWVPMMLFAVMFGLSMDYEVFLLSRIRESYDRTGDNSAAVADGVAATARVITAAAAVMVCVFGAFALGSTRSLKLFGLGLATAVLLDATVVRLVLVPATMELLGDRNWWLPGWLDRRLPTLRRPGGRDAPRPRAATTP